MTIIELLGCKNHTELVNNNKLFNIALQLPVSLNAELTNKQIEIFPTLVEYYTKEDKLNFPYDASIAMRIGNATDSEKQEWQNYKTKAIILNNQYRAKLVELGLAYNELDHFIKKLDFAF